jgi:hypothetical protein
MCAHRNIGKSDSINKTVYTRNQKHERRKKVKELAKRRKLPAILLTVVMLSALLAPAMTPPALAAAGEEVEWVEMTNPVSVNKLSGVWGSSGSDVYAVGTVKVEGKNQGIILRYDGSAWSQVSIPAVTKSFIGVWGSSANDVYAVGSGGVILHYNGSAWIQMIIPADVVLMGGVWGSSANDVYAVGHDGPTGSGVILHYNGSVWSKMTLPVTGSLIGVWGSSASDVYAGVSSFTTTAPIGKKCSLVPGLCILIVYGAVPLVMFLRRDTICYQGVSSSTTTTVSGTK